MSALPSHFMGMDDLQPSALFLNCGLMHDRVTQAMQRAQITQQHFLLCCIDVDQQATLHELYGDEGIRELIAQISSRILSILRPGDSLGQLQNRTLALLLEDLKNWQDIDPTIQEVFQCFAQPVIIDEQPHLVTASIGITEFDCQSKLETTELFEQAEFACYRVRRNRANSAQANDGQGYAFFGGHILARHSVQKMLSRSIEDGFARNELYVDLQPILQWPAQPLSLQQVQQLSRPGFASSGFAPSGFAPSGFAPSGFAPSGFAPSGFAPSGFAPSGYAVEALMRWRHPQAGVFLPDMLLRLLEENRLTQVVGDRMMTIAAQTWQQLLRSNKMGSDVKLCVNIHPDQLQHRDFVKTVQQLCTTYGLANQQLILEFKGSTLIHANGARATEQLHQLKQMGVLICVDNFGDVDAPLSCLHQLPLDIIKLAHALVSDLETCPRQLLLIEHLQQICQQLNINMIVQGVDSAEKKQKLHDIGCTMLQGNHLTPPCSINDLPTLCAANSME